MRLVMMFLLAAVHISGAAEPALQRVQVSQFHMGMMVDLIVYASDVAAGQAACGEAFARISALNRMLSDYEPESELNRLCAQAGQGPQAVGPDLFAVLSISQRIAEASGGRFDATAAPVIRLWRTARRTHQRPDPAGLASAQALVGHAKLHLDPVARTAALDAPGMLLDLGAVAKGYIGDQALAVLRQRGFPHAAFIAGGDMVFGMAPPGTAGWPVRPATSDLPEMALADCACSVSGDTEQFVEIDGVRYSHVLDAITGVPLTTRRMCIVIAPLGQAADPLSTLGTLLPEADFRAITAAMPGVRSWAFTLK